MWHHAKIHQINQMIKQLHCLSWDLSWVSSLISVVRVVISKKLVLTLAKGLVSFHMTDFSSALQILPCIAALGAWDIFSAAQVLWHENTAYIVSDHRHLVKLRCKDDEVYMSHYHFVRSPREPTLAHPCLGIRKKKRQTKPHSDWVAAHSRNWSFPGIAYCGAI